MDQSHECQICYNEFLEERNVIPLILTNCGHTICQKCVEEMMEEGDEENWEITCPFCKEITSIPDGESANLKKNFTVMDIVNSKMNKTGEVPVVVPDSDPLSLILPEKCAEDYAHPAVYYCATCHINFCEPCWRRAHRMQSFSSHEPAPIAEKPPICADHKDQVTDLVCLTLECDESSRMICRACFLDRRHFGHRVERFKTEFLNFRKVLEDASKRTECLKRCFKKNKEKIKETNDTYHPYHMDFYLKTEKIDKYFEKVLEHVNQARTDARAELKRFADNIITNLDIMAEYEDEKLRIEEYTTTEIQHLLSQDLGVLMEKREWIQELVTRKVDFAEPMLPDPMSQLQIYFPPLPLLQITVKPIYRLLGGIIHGDQTGNTDMFTTFLAENATPAEEPNRYTFKNRLLEIVDVDSYRGQLLRSMIHVQVTPESSEHLGTLINEYLATCVPHLLPDSPTLTFERIIVGVLTFGEVDKVLESLEQEFGENAMFRFITINEESGIEKMFEAAIDL